MQLFRGIILLSRFVKNKITWTLFPGLGATNSQKSPKKLPPTCDHGMELEDTQVPRAGATTMSEYAMEKWKRQSTWWRDKRESEVKRFVQVQWQLWLAWEKTVTDRRAGHCSEQLAWFFYLHFHLFILFSLGGGYKSGGWKIREKNGIGVHDVKFIFKKILLKIKQKQNGKHFLAVSQL